MTVSKAHRKKQKQYRIRSQKRANIGGLSNAQFRYLMKSFYEFCRFHGFYETRKETKEYNGKYLFQWQREIAEALLRSLFMKINTDLTISILRQVGKTETIGIATAFAVEKYFKYFNEPLNVAVIAPEKTTAVVPYERIEKYLNKKLLIDGGDTKQYKKTIKGDQIKLYGIYDEYKGSTIEGNTFQLVIRDEAHKGNDRKFIDEVRPATIGVIGCIVMIGNGGFRDCEYLKAIKRGNSKYIDQYNMKRENKLVYYTYDKAKPYLVELYEDGIESARVRLSNIDDEIAKNGLDSIETRKNYFCEWHLEMGEVVTKDQLKRCHNETIFWDTKKPTKLYMGFDFATWHDRTVATVMNEKKHIIDWIVVKDSNERCEAREQCERLRETCDDRGYTEHLIAIAFDATGVGSGGVNEFLQEEFSCDLVPYTFSGQKKHEWYAGAIESIATDYDFDRLQFDPNHQFAELFETEWCELQQRELPEKKYKSYSAPNQRGKFDDFVASFSIVNHMIADDTRHYKSLTPYKERFKPKEVPKDSKRFGYFNQYLGL